MREARIRNTRVVLHGEGGATNPEKFAHDFFTSINIGIKNGSISPFTQYLSGELNKKIKMNDGECVSVHIHTDGQEDGYVTIWGWSSIDAES